MNSSAEDSVREELGLLCNREIQIQQQKLDTETAFFQKSLQSAKAKAKETLRNQGILLLQFDELVLIYGFLLVVSDDLWL